MRTTAFGAFFLAALPFFGTPSWAADGDLDISFGNAGLTTKNVGSFDGAHAVALQPDGKIVVAGESAVLRYNVDGTLDSSFGSSGVVATATAGRSLALQADGKIVVAGLGFALARYDANGDLDTSFSGDGFETLEANSFGPEFWNAEGRAVVVQSDGKIVLAGYAESESGNIVFALARYNANGGLDTSFSGDGLLTTEFDAPNPFTDEAQDLALALAIQGDGKILAAGRATVYLGGIPRFALARYNSNGGLDSSFGTSGLVTTDFGLYAEAHAVTVQSDGKIVAVGRSDLKLTLARYGQNGSLDSSFGSGGIVATDFGDPDRFFLGTSVGLQADGKIVVTGPLSDNSTGQAVDFALARFESGGSLDTSFGDGGLVKTDFGNGHQHRHADTDEHGDRDADVDPDRYADRNADLDADWHPHSDSDVHALGDANRDGDCHTDEYADFDSDGDSHLDLDTNLDAEQLADVLSHPDCDQHRDVDADLDSHVHAD